jgi:hypothetical protein
MGPAVHDDLGGNGHRDGHWSAWFDGLQAGCDDRAETTITGWVADQESLHGLPAKVGDWALSCSRCAAPTRPTTQMEQRDAAATKPTAQAATPRRRQRWVARRQQRRRPPSPIDRRTPSGRLLPY